MEDNIGSVGFDAPSNAQGAQITPAIADATGTAPTKQERVFSQAELNEIVKKVKHETAEGIKRISAQQPEYAEQKYGVAAAHQQPASLNEADYRRMASEEAQRLRNEWVSEAQSKAESEQAQRIVQGFWDKVESGKTTYDDFSAVTGEIDLARFPNVVQILSEHLDNSADVLYELGKNRSKLYQIEQMARESSKDGIAEAKRLAQSIKDNKTSTKSRVANTPLSQNRPSNVGTDTNGAMSVTDLRRKYRV